MQVSKDGSQFVMFCADGRVRVWKFATGKLRRTYDESLEVSQGQSLHMFWVVYSCQNGMLGGASGRPDLVCAVAECISTHRCLQAVQMASYPA